jgi:hypothetical protein
MMMYVIKACGKLNSGKGQFIELVSEIDEVNNKLQEEDSLRELEARIAISPKQEEFRIM